MTAWLRTLALGAVLVACGGEATGSGEATDSGKATDGALPPQQRLVQLSNDEYKELCDWLAGLFGGYNMAINCGPETQNLGPTDQDSCVTGYMQLASTNSMCAATVADFETCHEWQTKNFCVTSGGSPPAACASPMSVSCMAQ
jgi:hypothetical protein